MRFAWLEINGWGKVAADVDATAVVVASGQATITLSSATGFADWIGATVYLTDCDPLPDGHYTLLSVSAPDIVVACAGQPDGSDTPSGKCRPEAFYRLCTQRPDVATSTEALATWLPVVPVDSITPTFGQSVDLKGGVATADGFGLAATYDLDGFPILAALLRYVFATLDSGSTPVQLAAEVTQATASWTVTASAGTQNTTVYVLDGEAVSPSGVSGTTWTVPTRRRGILGTQAAPHTSTSLIFDGLPTPQGARCRLYVADLDSTDLQTTVHSVSFGVVTDVNVTEGTTLIELKAQGETIAPRVQSVGDRITATAAWASIQDSDDASAQVVITQATAADRWQWVKAGPLALQLIDSEGFPAVTVGNDPITRLPQVRYGVDAYLRPQTPACVEFVDDGVEWLNLHGHQAVRAVDGVGALELDQPYWTDEPGADRMRLLCGPYDSQPTFSTRYPDLEPCHVFAPAGGTLATEYVARRNDGAIRINPVEVVLQVLASTGTGANDYGFTAFGMASNYDVAPGQVGMGVPASQVDLVSFAAVWSALDGLSVTNCYVTASDAENLAGWLDTHVLRPYSLALVQTMRGQWRIVDMAAVDGRYDGAFVLDRSYVYTDPGARPRIEWAQNTAQSIQAIRCRWKIPNRFGFAAVRDVELFVNGTRSDRFGSAKLYGLVAPETLLIDCPVSLGDDVDSAAALVDRYRALVGAMYRPLPVVTWGGFANGGPDVGDLVSVEIENVPAPLGTRSTGGATTTLARVTDAKWDRLTDRVDYTAVVISTDATGIIPRAWAPAANVTAFASMTALTLSTAAYVISPRPGDAMTNDLAGGLAIGDRLLLMTKNLTLRSTDGPATILTINTTSGALTLVSAWQASSVNITPAVDDIVIPCDWTTAPLANDIFAYQDGGTASRSWWQ